MTLSDLAKYAMTRSVDRGRQLSFFMLKCVAMFTAFILYCHLPQITV